MSFVPVDGGAVVVGNPRGDGYAGDGEHELRSIDLPPFSLAPTTVTNAEFAAFVDATGFRTDAEGYGWSFVFGGLLPDDFPETRGVAAAPWWRQVHGASWRRPEGPDSAVEDRPDHPVVHVSWNDARAYADWAGGRLPTEAEWEHAARGGLDGHPFPWGDELTPGGEHRMNVWQGSFPDARQPDDGWYGTAPVRSFPPNAFGLYEMTGNVWEWCADPFGEDGHRVMRGGSYLCHESYCRRYRVDARSGSEPDSTSGNVGFRLAAP
jgi:formylglycine-generating enzyme